MKLISTILLSTVILFTAQANAQEFGKATYRDLGYQGAITASDEPYDGNQMTAAHKIHPFGTRLKVTRQDNGRSVIVRVNDRGPYVQGQLIAVSYAAAKALDMIRDNVIEVKIEVISTPDNTSETRPDNNNQSSRTNKPTAENTPNNTNITASNTTNPQENEFQERSGSTSNNTSAESNSQSTTTDKNKTPVTNNRTNNYDERLLTKPYEKYGLYEIKVLSVNKAGYGVQVASLSSYENAMKELTRLQAKKINNALLSIEPTANGMSFKVIVGPYETRQAATQQISSLRRSLSVKGFVVDLGTIQY